MCWKEKCGYLLRRHYSLSESVRNPGFDQLMSYARVCHENDGYITSHPEPQ